MAQITKKNLILGFKSAAGKEINLTVKTPAEGLTGTQVAAVMDEIISSSALGKTDVAATKGEAKYVIQQEENITLA